MQINSKIEICFDQTDKICSNYQQRKWQDYVYLIFIG